MTLIRIRLQPEDDKALEECVHLTCELNNLKIVSLNKWFKAHHLSVLLNMTPTQVCDYVATSLDIHGFVYKKDVYIHPTVFTRKYMKGVIATIDDKFKETYVH